jgi:hypothetical protein
MSYEDDFMGVEKDSEYTSEYAKMETIPTKRHNEIVEERNKEIDRLLDKIRELESIIGVLKK